MNEKTQTQTGERLDASPGSATSPSEPPGRYCEVLIDAQHNMCGKAATHCYPVMGGDYMALCTGHAKKHPEAWPIKEVI